jgi:DMSO/TMAO reductase YedYZ heme-binding membrane subunit
MISARSIVQLFTYYLLPITALLLFVLGFNGVLSMQWISHFAGELGEYSFILLCIILFIKPLSVLLPWHWCTVMVSYRRELGVLACWLAVWHGAYLLISLGYLSSIGLRMAADPTNLLIWGLIAIVGIIAAGITSNRFAARRLGRRWRLVQMSVYPAFMAVCIHRGIALGTMSSYVILTLYAVLKGAEFVKRRGVTTEKSQDTSSS